jgi:hypothetical protein
MIVLRDIVEKKHLDDRLEVKSRCSSNCHLQGAAATGSPTFATRVNLFIYGLFKDCS